MDDFSESSTLAELTGVFSAPAEGKESVGQMQYTVSLKLNHVFQGDGGALHDAQGQNAQQAFGVDPAFLLLHPDAAFELVGLLDKIGSRPGVQAHLIVHGNFLCKHSIALLL